MGSQKIKEYEELYSLEPVVTQFTSQVIQPHFKIIEAGSHVGLYTMRMAALLDAKKGGQLISFEMNPFLSMYVNKSIYMNGFQDKAQAYNFAVLNQSGPINLKIKVNSQKSMIQVKKEVKKQSKQQVYGIKLDDIWLNDQLPQIDFIHIDIESADILALQGAYNLIKNSPKIVVIFE